MRPRLVPGRLRELVPAAAHLDADVDDRAAQGAFLREGVPRRLDHFRLRLALGLDLCSSGRVGTVDGTLGMDSVARIGGFAADWANFPDGGGDDRFRFKNAHMAPILQHAHVELTKN